MTNTSFTALMIRLSLGLIYLSAGFGGTPFINAFLLGLNLFALWVEKDAIRKLWKRDFSAFNQSDFYVK